MTEFEDDDNNVQEFLNEHLEDDDDSRAALFGTKAIAVSSNKPLTSKYRGVCWNRKNKRWQAAINSAGKYLYLGSYDTEDEAARVFDKAAVRVRGSKARLNFKYSNYVDDTGNIIPDPMVEQLLSEAQDPNRPRRARAVRKPKDDPGSGSGTGGAAHTHGVKGEDDSAAEAMRLLAQLGAAALPLTATAGLGLSKDMGRSAPASSPAKGKPRGERKDKAARAAAHAAALAVGQGSRGQGGKAAGELVLPSLPVPAYDTPVDLTSSRGAMQSIAGTNQSTFQQLLQGLGVPQAGPNSSIPGLLAGGPPTGQVSMMQASLAGHTITTTVGGVQVPPAPAPQGLGQQQQPHEPTEAARRASIIAQLRSEKRLLPQQPFAQQQPHAQAVPGQLQLRPQDKPQMQTQSQHFSAALAMVQQPDPVEPVCLMPQQEWTPAPPLPQLQEQQHQLPASFSALLQMQQQQLQHQQEQQQQQQQHYQHHQLRFALPGAQQQPYDQRLQRPALMASDLPAAAAGIPMPPQLASTSAPNSCADTGTAHGTTRVSSGGTGTGLGGSGGAASRLSDVPPKGATLHDTAAPSAVQTPVHHSQVRASQSVSVQAVGGVAATQADGPGQGSGGAAPNSDSTDAIVDAPVHGGSSGGAAACGSTGMGGTKDMFASISRSLPEGAALDCVLPSDRDHILGVLYSLPDDERTGAGVWNGRNGLLRNLGLYGSFKDAKQAAQGCILIMLDMEPAAPPPPPVPPSSQQQQQQLQVPPQQQQQSAHKQVQQVHMSQQAQHSKGHALLQPKSEQAGGGMLSPAQLAQPHVMQQQLQVPGQMQLGGDGSSLLAVQGVNGQVQYFHLPSQDGHLQQFFVQQPQVLQQQPQPQLHQQAQLTGMSLGPPGMQGPKQFTMSASAAAANLAAAQSAGGYQIVLPSGALSQGGLGMDNLIAVIPQNSGQSYSGGLGFGLSGRYSLSTTPVVWGGQGMAMGGDGGGMSLANLGAGIGGPGALSGGMAGVSGTLAGGQAWQVAVQPDPPTFVDVSRNSLLTQEMTDESAAQLAPGPGSGSGASGQRHRKRPREGDGGPTGSAGGGMSGLLLGGHGMMGGAPSAQQGDTTDGSVSASGRDTKRSHLAPTPQFAALQSLAHMDVQEALQLFFAQKQQGGGRS